MCICGFQDILGVNVISRRTITPTHPNPEWPNYYATSEQIHAYLKKTAIKYDLERYIQYSHSVESARWDEDSGKWTLAIRTGDHVLETECDVFINAGGVLYAASVFPDARMKELTR